MENHHDCNLDASTARNTPLQNNYDWNKPNESLGQPAADASNTHNNNQPGPVLQQFDDTSTPMDVDGASPASLGQPAADASNTHNQQVGALVLQQPGAMSARTLDVDIQIGELKEVEPMDISDEDVMDSSDDDGDPQDQVMDSSDDDGDPQDVMDSSDDDGDPQDVNLDVSVKPKKMPQEHDDAPN